MLNKEIRELMRENAYSFLELLILEKQPFRIVLWNADNWNRPLPDSIMDNFPTQLVLEIQDMALEDSFVDENTGEIIITTIFEDMEFFKTVLYDEIIAILDLEGQPYILNNFYPETGSEDLPFVEIKPEITRDSIIDMVALEDIPKEAAALSMDSFIKKNPFLKNRLKLKELK